jgi:hypothetical protein
MPWAKECSWGLVAGLDGGEPAFEFLLAAAAGHDLCEAAHVGGQGVQVRAGVLDAGELRSFVIGEGVRAAEQLALAGRAGARLAAALGIAVHRTRR